MPLSLDPFDPLTFSPLTFNVNNYDLKAIEEVSDMVTTNSLNITIPADSVCTGSITYANKGTSCYEPINPKLVTNHFTDIDAQSKKTDESDKKETPDVYHPIPDKIIFNDPVTVVFWTDKTKTIVRKSDNDPYDKYMAFCAALAKKVYENNTKIHKIIESGIDQKEKDRIKAEKLMTDVHSVLTRKKSTSEKEPVKTGKKVVRKRVSAKTKTV